MELEETMWEDLIVRKGRLTNPEGTDNRPQIPNEVTHELKNMKTEKSIGPVDMPIELVRLNDENTVYILTGLMRFVNRVKCQMTN